jgi:hypothetical protein
MTVCPLRGLRFEEMSMKESHSKLWALLLVEGSPGVLSKARSGKAAKGQREKVPVGMCF